MAARLGISTLTRRAGGPEPSSHGGEFHDSRACRASSLGRASSASMRQKDYRWSVVTLLT